jgi:transposase-like protein
MIQSNTVQVLHWATYNYKFDINNHHNNNNIEQMNNSYSKRQRKASCLSQRILLASLLSLSMMDTQLQWTMSSKDPHFKAMALLILEISLSNY